MSNKLYFDNIPKPIVIIIHELSSRETNENLCLVFGEKYYNTRDICKEILNTINTTSEDKDYLTPFNIIYNSESNKRIKWILFLLQQPIVEYDLIRLRNIQFKNNKDKYYKYDTLLYQYYIFKMYNPFFNSSDINNIYRYL